MKSEEDIDHMPVPGGPGTMFIFAHAGIAFAVFKTLLDSPAQRGGVCKLGKRHIFRGVGESIFDLPVGGATNQQPDGIFLRQSPMGREGPQAGDIRTDRAFRSFRYNQGMPDRLAGFGELSHGFGLRLSPQDFEPLGPRPTAAIPRKTHFGLPQKDLGIGPDAGQIVELFRESSQESRVGTKGGITADPSSGKKFFFYDLLDKGEGDLRLGLEGEILGDQIVGTAFRIGSREPFLGHIQLAGEQAIAFGTGVPEKDSGLAVVHFARGAAVLPGDPDGLFSFFGEFGTVHGDHALGTGQGIA